MEQAIVEATKTKKVGLIIHNNASLFSNGILQNAYFLHQCLERMGFTCQFLCHEENPSPFDYCNMSVKQICKNELVFNPREYHTLITVTRGLGKELYDYVKTFNIFVAGFVCGNCIMHDMEDYVRGTFYPGTTTFIGRGSPVDEIWLIPSYKHALDYMSVIRGAPAYLVPHLWSPEIVRHSAVHTHKTSEAALHYNYAVHRKPQVNLLVMEPNIALFKNAWIPIVSTEYLHKTNKTILDTIYVFNYPDKQNAHYMSDHLDIKDKLRRFKRLTVSEIMIHFNTLESMPIIVSHQVLNGLNYVYYEALYYGWPLVHNSKEMEDCGYYYPENDIVACARAIEYAYNHHHKNLHAYIEKGRKFMERVDPQSDVIGKTWEQYIKAGLGRTLPLPLTQPSVQLNSET